MITGLALAVGMIATTANTQPLLPPAAPPQAAPSWGATTPFQSGFSELDGIPDTIVSDQWQGESSQWQGSSSLGGDVIFDGPTGDVSFDGSEGCACDECGCGDCGDCGCGECGKSKAPKMEHCWTQRCDMPQHIPYYPPAHGNYYFRPYSVAQLARQQAMVVSWGGDPRNPYSNAIFKQVYAEMGMETIEVPESDATLPAISEPVQIEEAVEVEIDAAEIVTEAVEVEADAVEIETELAELEAAVDAEPTDDLFPPTEAEDADGSPTDDAKLADESPVDDVEPADEPSVDEAEDADDLFGDDEDTSDNDDLFGDDEDTSDNDDLFGDDKDPS